MTLPEADDQPRAMRDAGVRERGRAMLGIPHIIELTSFAEKLLVRVVSAERHWAGARLPHQVICEKREL